MKEISLSQIVPRFLVKERKRSLIYGIGRLPSQKEKSVYWRLFPELVNLLFAVIFMDTVLIIREPFVSMERIYGIFRKHSGLNCEEYL